MATKDRAENETLVSFLLIQGSFHCFQCTATVYTVTMVVLLVGCYDCLEFVLLYQFREIDYSYFFDVLRCLLQGSGNRKYLKNGSWPINLFSIIYRSLPLRHFAFTSGENLTQSPMDWHAWGQISGMYKQWAWLVIKITTRTRSASSSATFSHPLQVWPGITGMCRV